MMISTINNNNFEEAQFTIPYGPVNHENVY